MTPTEAIASIRASIAAGYSPSLSDIEVLIAECGRVEAMEALMANIAAPIYSDEKCFALTRYLHRANPNWAAEQLHSFSLRAKAILTTQSPRNENG